jgi:TetR/AcrR family transcriptional regulator, upper aerobic nicotinate degradation pathway regulator
MKNRPSKVPKRAEELVATALNLFARQDVTSVTIKDIASGLGVNTALIYYYFDSKDDLFRATLKYCIDKTMATFRRLEEKHSEPVKMISAWFATHAEMSTEIRQLVKILLDYKTSGTQTKITDAAVRDFYEQESKILSSRIWLGVEKGIFQKITMRQAVHAAQIASTHLDGIMVRSLIHEKFDIAAAIQDLERIFWSYLGYSPARANGKRRNARIRPTGLRAQGMRARTSRIAK